MNDNKFNIIITPEMIDAGATVIENLMNVVSVSSLAQDVYIAMHMKSKHAPAYHENRADQDL